MYDVYLCLQVKAEKYDQPYDIISLEKRDYVNRPAHNDEKKNIILAAQVDYNILTNEKLGEQFFRNTIRNAGSIKVRASNI